MEAWSNQGKILHETGDDEGALRSYRRAVELDPDDIQARTRLLARRIPSVPLSEAESRAARRAFEEELLAFEAWLAPRSLGAADALTLAQQQFFYLAYEEASNRALLERYRGACAARLAKLGVGRDRPPRVPAAPARSPPSGRFKLGFVSAHVHDHSVFHAILRGWLERLDRDRFELHLFSLGAKHDEVTRHALASVDRPDPVPARPSTGPESSGIGTWTP